MAQQRTGVSTMAVHHPVAGIAAGVRSQRVEGAVGGIALLKGIDMLIGHTLRIVGLFFARLNIKAVF